MADWETAPQRADSGWETAPARMNPNLAAQGRNAEGVRENMRTGAEFLSQRDPGIDYASGISNATFRAGFSRMSSDAEKAGYLDRSVGKDKWGKDSFGAYYIKPEGLRMFGMDSKTPVSIDEQTASRYDLADVAGDIPAIVGGVGGGMAATGLGTLPGIALSALGAAGGKAFDEIIKNIQGYQVGGPGEVGGRIAYEGAMGGGGEVVSRTLFPVGRFLMGPGASRMTPEKKAMADSAIEQGFKVRAGSVTDAPLLARWEGMVRMIFGDLYEDTNKRAAEKGLEKLGSAAGTRFSKEAAGEAVSGSIKAKRVKFGEDANKLYGEVDALVGNQPIVQTAEIKKQAEALLESLPKTKDGQVIGGKDKLIRDILNMGDSITVTNAQRLRTMLREASESPDLIPDVAMRDARQLRKAVDKAFENTKTLEGAPKAAIEKLLQADKFYSQGIKQFDLPAIAAITKDASKRTVDSDMVVDYLIKPGRTVRLRQVKNLVGDEQWAKVKSAHAEDLLSNVVQGTDDPLKSIFNGKTFRDTLEKYGKETLTEVHGKEWVDSAYKYANALMLSQKTAKASGGIVAASIALHPIINLPKLVWLRAAAKVMENPGTFKYLTEGIRLGPSTKEGAALVTRFMNQALALAKDETGSATVTITPPEKQ